MLLKLYVNKYNPSEIFRTFLVLINEVRRRDQTSAFSPVAFLNNDVLSLKRSLS